MNNEIENEINVEIESIIQAYDELVGGIESKAKRSIEGRAYGGIIRAGKGKLVESIAQQVVEMAWQVLGEVPRRLDIHRKSIKIPIKKEYIERIRNPEVKAYIRKNLANYYYRLRVDLHVYIDNKFVLAIECKSYTENAMLKRILVDFTLLKEIHPSLNFVLFQLESQLGGDYSELKYITFGSTSTHTLLSYFDIDLHIITLLKGERKVKKPIHKPEFFKPLTKERLKKAIETIYGILEEYV